MNLHEQVAQFYSAWQNQSSEMRNSLEGGKTKLDVVIKHLISWESLLIIILTYALSKLLKHRQTERQRE
jgi:hypothetical protein